MGRQKTIYWIATGLLSAQMLFSSSFYIFKHSTVTSLFEALGFPGYIVLPLAMAKILGVVAILTKKSRTLKEWAYAGFFFNFTLAFFAHVAVGDGQQFGAVIAMVFLLTSYYYDRKLYKR